MTRRDLFFWFGCIPFRFLLAIIAYIIPTKFLPHMTPFTMIPAIAFLFMYTFSIKESKNSRGFFNGKIWWTHLRPIHGVLYLLFSIYALKKHHFAYKILVLDTIIAVGAKLIK